MMHKYFSKITWFNQRGTYIYTGADNALFLIGVATN